MIKSWYNLLLVFYGFAFCGFGQSNLDEINQYIPESGTEIIDIIIKPGSLPYSQTKSNIQTRITKLRQQLETETIRLDSVKGVFTEQLVNTIIPYWYGTPWSFEGHTAIPNQGEIACGYFVSTTLRDMGLRLNRYTLAQKSPIDEATIISCGLLVQKIMQSDTILAIEEILSCTSDGIYFIGFDQSHVGYLLKRRGRLFLIHSNYLEPNAVCIEEIENSKVFKSYQVFYVVPISDNDKLIHHWLYKTTMFS